MGADNYDDLDDLLDDVDLQKQILAKSPHKDGTSTEKESPDVSKLHISESADSTKPAPKTQSHAESSLPEAEGLPQELEKLLQASAGDPEAQAALQTLLTGLAAEEPAAHDASKSSGGTATAEDAEKPPQSFEDTIAATMNRLNQSKKSSGTGPNASGELNEEDLMEKLLADVQKSISSGGGGGFGEGSANELDGMLSTLLAELSSKEVLYDPLKELHMNYPDWLSKHQDTLEKSELERYRDQQALIADVIVKFEDPKYSDNDKKARDFITEKMMLIQETGSPPKELVGDVAGGAFPGIPGMGGSNAPPDLPEDCATQ